MSAGLAIGVDGSRALRAQRTGTERYSLEIIRHLLALPEARRHTWHLYVDGEPGDLLPTGPHIRLHVLPARRLWTHVHLGRAVGRGRPDVLFVPAHVIPLAPPAALPPCVVTVHDLAYIPFPDTYPAVQRLYLAWSTRWSVAASRRVIAVSRATALDLTRYLGTAPQKIRVIAEAAPPPLPLPAEETVAQVRVAYGLHRPYALFLSTLQPRKNVLRLLDAFRLLLESQAVEFDLVLAGANRMGDLIPQQIRRPTLAGRVHLLGYVPESHLPGLFGGARLFCYPSLYEGFGLPVLEAQQMGVPVMTADNSALPEVAGDGAILVDPTDVEAMADAMLRLSQDEALRQTLIARGHENVKRFSWAKAARETLAVLEAAAGRR